MARGLRTVVSLDSFPGLLIPVLQATNPGTFIVKGVLCLVRLIFAGFTAYLGVLIQYSARICRSPGELFLPILVRRSIFGRNDTSVAL